MFGVTVVVVVGSPWKRRFERRGSQVASRYERSQSWVVFSVKLQELYEGVYLAASGQSTEYPWRHIALDRVIGESPDATELGDSSMSSDFNFVLRLSRAARAVEDPSIRRILLHLG